jgi:hypothetical protein
MLTGPFVFLLTLAIIGVLHHLDAARRRRHTSALTAWAGTWQHGFFTALEARLAPTQLYR